MNSPFRYGRPQRTKMPLTKESPRCMLNVITLNIVTQMV